MTRRAPAIRIIAKLQREDHEAHEDSTSNQVAVLIIPSLEGEVLEEYSIKVVETWKLGRADKDNGVQLLIVRNDRKVRIEVGNGLEGDLPDITCGRIIRNEIVPRFKSGDYEACAPFLRPVTAPMSRRKMKARTRDRPGNFVFSSSASLRLWSACLHS